MKRTLGRFSTFPNIPTSPEYLSPESRIPNPESGSTNPGHTTLVEHIYVKVNISETFGAY
jgi:hypothetical protein